MVFLFIFVVAELRARAAVRCIILRNIAADTQLCGRVWDMIEKCIADWHEYIIGKRPGGLEALIADECVFISPIVFKPQVGKELTLAYLRAAGGTLGGQGTPGEDKPAENSGEFKYTKEILAGNHAMLEFETEMDGKYVNGVDIITCNDEGKIIEFKVMIRPLQAVNAVHAAMGAMLEKMKAA